MPPRHAYWTILVDDQPTAFRAHDAGELEPTLNRLRERHPSAVMKWFERGKLFDSRDQAREQGLGKGERRWEGPRPDRSHDERPRDRKWRPGGEHRDPRQQYKDAKKAKWGRFKKRIRDRAEHTAAARTDMDPESFSPPHGDPLRDQIDQEREPQRSGWRDGAPSRPHGDAIRPGQRPRSSERRPWKPKPPRDGPGDRRREDQRGGYQSKPQKRQFDRRRERSDWRDREGASHERDRHGGSERQPADRGRWREDSSRRRDSQRSGWSARPPGDSAHSDRGRRGKDQRVESRKPWHGGSGGRPPGRSKAPWGGAGNKPWGTRPGAGKPAGKPSARKRTAANRRGPRKRGDDE
jgi:hypothetical protein